MKTKILTDFQICISVPLMSSVFAINDFYIMNPVSMDFPLDWIYINRPRSSYITPFLKNTFLPACFPLDNT